MNPSTHSNGQFMDAEYIATRLENASRNGDGWKACCPAHDDHTPSLSISDGSNGAPLVRCHAGCEQEAVISRLKVLNLWPGSSNGFKRPASPVVDIDKVRQEVKQKYLGDGNDAPGRQKAVYDYVDEQGKLLYQTVRYEPKDFRQRRPDGNDGWSWNLQGVRRVLYRLPKVLRANLVHIVEGEKDVQTLEKFKWTATCNAMGAGKWKPEYSACLKGKTVVIFPDNDDPGRQHAATVAQSVYSAGARLVKVVTLPKGKDVTDWVAAGSTKEQLIALVKGTPKYQPSAPAPTAGDVITVRASEVRIRPVAWLWPGRIPRGKITLIAGDPGLSKSTLTVAIAAVVTGSAGRWGMRFWPDGARCDGAANVVFLSAEDDEEDTICPRLKAAGADLTRVHIARSVLTGYTGDATPVEKLFSLQTDLHALDAKLNEIKGVALLVIDPVTAYLDGVDSYKNSEVRGALAPLRALAQKHNMAVVLITHVNKDGAKALMRVSGSLAFVAAARTAYLVMEDPLDPENRRRLLLSLKNNLGPAASGLAYTVETAAVRHPTGTLDTAKIAWDTDTLVAITAQEALNQTRGSGRDGSEELGPKERMVMELLEVESDLKPAEIATKLQWKDNNTKGVLLRLRGKKKVKSHHGVYRLADPV